MILYEVPMMFHKVPLLFHGVLIMFHEDPIMSYKVSMWLFIGFPLSWSYLCLPVVVYRFLLALILPLLACGCAQTSPGLASLPISVSDLCQSVSTV